VAMSADFAGNDYLWRWATRVTSGGASQKVKADFKQSSFYGAPISPARLRKRADSYVPANTEGGETDRFILSLMDGRTPHALRQTH